MERKTRLTLCLAILLCGVMLLCGCGGGADSALDPQNPVTVEIWNYYNGDQLAAFDQLVEEFNSTVGLEKGVVVVNISQGDINTLADSLLASVEGQAGAENTPALAAVYGETAFILDQADALQPLDGYFSQEELEAYVPGFLDEGRFNADNDLLLFPILKSTELFTVNETDWAPFAAATGIAVTDITTKEELTAAAQTYYEWTDSLTPQVAEDGKALYGRDSVANYIYVGSYQLGHPLFQVENGQVSVDMDRDTFKTLWDNYYIPFVNGYFGAYARFRSEDCKTGKILALTSSSSSVSYLPTSVTGADDTTHDITTYAGPALPFAEAVHDAVVQQGASYCLLKGEAAQMEGAVEFLKWFTQPQRNLTFALMSGYSPVTLVANDQDSVRSAYSGETDSEKGQNILDSLLLGADAFHNRDAYASKPFQGSKEVRSILGDALETRAATDRAAVEAALASGVSREDAVAEYVSEEYFDAWFQELSAQVNAAIGH